jgi:S-adenosylmethionine synthetase
MSWLSQANGRMVWTAESVTEGHPDKIADAISEEIVDTFLRLDKYSRTGAEAFLSSGHQVVLGGEVGIPRGADQRPAFHLEDVNFIKLVRDVIRGIGYTDISTGFDTEHCIVTCNLKAQSEDIAVGVVADEQGAGDQGMMFGYACRETPTLMPAPIYYAHRLAQRLSELRRFNEIPNLRPDGKSQVTLAYENERPVKALKIVLAVQHGPEWGAAGKQGELKALLGQCVVESVIPDSLLDGLDWDTQFTVNGTGAFEKGGPAADAGLTGRKIIVDTYGGMAPHGGGAFSGKDPSKVDRSANYYARYCAKNIVAAGLADRCQVRVAYVIGKAEPIGLDISTFGTEKVSPLKIDAAVRECFNFEPASMLTELDLLRPIYRPLAAYGHIGREDLEHATWEKTDKAEALQKLSIS